MSSTVLDPAVNPDADGLVGGLTLWPSNVLPSAKYMFAEGQAVSRSDYSLLFSRLGEEHGVGDGSTTFNLPDFLDSTFRGGAADELGDTGGSATASLPGHTHDAGTLTHSGAVAGGGSEGLASSPSVQVSGFGGAVTGSTGSASSGTGDNWPPYVKVRVIIKVR